MITSGAEIDSLTIKDLESRYGLTRSNVYNRLKGLTKLGYEMESEKQGTKSIYNATQIGILDALNEHLQGSNKSITSFPPASQPKSIGQDTSELSYRTVGQDNAETSYRTVGQDTSEVSYEAVGQGSSDLQSQEHQGFIQASYVGQDTLQPSYIGQNDQQSSYVGQDTSKLSYKTPESQQGLKLPAIFTTDLIELFVQRISALFPTPLSPADRGLELVHLRELEEAYEKGWQLTTNNIANLLGLKASTISGYGQQFEDAGFIFTRVGKRKGGQLAWLVRKAPRPTELLD